VETDDLEVLVKELQARLDALESAAVNKPYVEGARARCFAELPHPDLVFQRGPNKYLCPCGQVYEKNGKGGIREVASGS